MVSDKERRIALFIDFENLVTNTGISPSTFDLQPAMDRLLERGKVVFRRAYCDWSRFREATRRLHDFGVELIDVPPSTRAGKNGADMRLVIDALELCYAREHIDTFAIASGDSDFCPLAYKLRENNRMLIGLGVKEATCDGERRGAPGVAAKVSRRARCARDSGDRARGRCWLARAGDGSVEPVVDQGDHRPQGARLRRAGGRILHLQQDAARDGAPGTAQAPAAERPPMVRVAARRGWTGEGNRLEVTTEARSARARVSERLPPRVALALDRSDRPAPAVADLAAVPGEATAPRSSPGAKFDGGACAPASGRLNPGLVRRHVLHGLRFTTEGAVASRNAAEPGMPRK